MSTSGAATAPLCLNRKARFVPSADSSAQMSPTPTDSETPVTAEPSSRAFTERKGATAEAGAVLRNSRHAVQLVAHTGAELPDEPHISHDTVRTQCRAR